MKVDVNENKFNVFSGQSVVAIVVCGEDPHQVSSQAVIALINILNHLPERLRMATASVLRTKLVVVGDWAVGKTAAVQQFLNAGTAFPKNYSMTLGGEVRGGNISWFIHRMPGVKQAGPYTRHLRCCRAVDLGLLWT